MVKLAYLTIDDAPSSDMKKKIEFLRSKGIPAIWFCEGYLLEKMPESVIHAIKKGFVIGNHTYDHPHVSEITLGECFDEIKTTDELIEAVYETAGVKRPAKVFRFPYGDKGGGKEVEKGWPEDRKDFIQAIQDFLRKLGYKQPKFEGIKYDWFLRAGLLRDVDVSWTYDCMEYLARKKEPTFGIIGLKQVLERMDEDVPDGGRGLNFPDSNEIVLTHDHSETADMFVPIIEKLLDKGLKFELPNFK